MSRVEIDRVRQARADWGHDKYGDRDERRDHCVDMLEELLDVKNILNREALWTSRNGTGLSKSIAYLGYHMEINNKVNSLIELIQDYDNFLRMKNVKIDDSNAGDRIGFTNIK